MADKFNLDGFSVDENDVCTADGGFVGDVTGRVYGGKTAYSSSGDVNLFATLHELSAASSDVNLTLGAASGVTTLHFYATNVSNACTISFGGISPAFNLVTLAAVGDAAILTYDSLGSKWICTSLVGTATIS